MIKLQVIKLALLLLFFFTQLKIDAQINLSPTFLMIDERTGISELYVHNGSNTPQEVSISFVFGYPSANAEGTTIMVYDDSLKQEQYGLNQHIRVFPQRFIINPQNTQTVILQVRPMRNRDDGVYFTRAVISSNMISKDIDRQTDDGINMQINYVLNQNIPVMYRKGNVYTGLSVNHLNTEISDGRLVVTKQLAPTGNAPFNGSVTAMLRCSSGHILATQHQTVVAYFDLTRKLSLQLPNDKLTKGEYSLMLTYETKRRDISPDQLVQAPAKTQEITIHLE